MNNVRSHTFGIVLISMSLLFGWPATGVADDTGSSHNLFLIDRLDEDSFFVGRANLVTRDGFSDAFFGYIDGNYRRNLDEHWALEVGYRHAMLELPGGWREESRPMLALYWRDEVAGGRFSNRNRLEFRHFEGNAKDRIRYRNESVWRSNGTVTRYKLKPFVEEEIFIDLTDDKLNENWLTLGVSSHWTKQIKWKLGYRLQSRRPGEQWLNRHMLVTGVSFFWMD